MRWLPLLLLLADCRSPVESSFAPSNAIAFQPPADYARYWQHMEDCAHSARAFTRVSWAYVPGGGFSCPDGNCDGWWQPTDAIYLAHQRMGDSLLVEHEMLHDLLQTGDHPPVFDSCGVR